MRNLFGNEIELWRNKNCMSSRKLSRYCGVSQQTVRNIETGKSKKPTLLWHVNDIIKQLIEAGVCVELTKDELKK